MEKKILTREECENYGRPSDKDVSSNSLLAELIEESEKAKENAEREDMPMIYSGICSGEMSGLLKAIEIVKKHASND